MSTAYLVLTLLAGPLVGGGVVYYIQSRIRINEQREMAGIQGGATAQQAPMDMLRGELAAKGVALQQTQEQFFLFVESQMKRNDATTAAMLNMAAESRAQTEALKAVGVSLQDHREESAGRAGKMYDRIGLVNERMASIESGMKIAADTAHRAANTALEAVQKASECHGKHPA